VSATIAAALLLLVVWFGPDPMAARRVPAAADTPEPFTIGLLRRDGVVTPFAAFDGHAWTAPWPANLSSVEVPISVDAVPRKWWGKTGPIDRMALWSAGERRGTIRLGAPVTVPIMCSPRLGLRSDYVSQLPAPPSGDQSYPKEGLVVSGAIPVEGISAVAPAAPEWTASEALLEKPFDGAEATAADAFTAWKHPISHAERRKAPLALEALYKAPMDTAGWTAYRFQAVKRYPPRPDDRGCGLISSATGWITRGPGDKHWTQIVVRVTYCDRMDDVFTLPLGVIRAGEKSYWIYQLSGYDREAYAVSRPTPKQIETEVLYRAGSCPD
jgi:hypothetical protein